MCNTFLSNAIIDSIDSNLHLILLQHSGPYIKKLNEQVIGKFEGELKARYVPVY